MPTPLAGLDGFDSTTPFIADACMQLQLPVRLGRPGLLPIRPQLRAAGRVAPAVHSGSTDAFLEAISLAVSGDILVIDNNGRLDEGCSAIWLLERRTSAAWRIIVDGVHRDSAAIRAIGIPVWSRGTAPNGPLELRRRHVTALEAATCGPTT